MLPRQKLMAILLAVGLIVFIFELVRKKKAKGRIFLALDVDWCGDSYSGCLV